MIEVVRLMQKAYAVNEIQEKVIQIGKRYTTSCSDERLTFWLVWFFGSKIDFKKLEPYNPREIINELLTRYYPYERIIKYSFMQHVKRSGVLVFELPISDSRVDISIFGKNSHAFEIKTEYDILDRMGKQISDYSQCFDYTSVVVPHKFLAQASEILPISCGIILYSHETGKLRISFTEIRKPVKNEVQARMQLENLTKTDIESILKSKNNLNTHLPKSQLIDEVLNTFSPLSINKKFKIKNIEKYTARWNYVLENYRDILPVDFQTVYSYQKSKSLVE